MIKLYSTLLLSILTVCSHITVNAQSVGYYGMDFSVIKEDSSFYIIVKSCSDDMRFVNEPTMKIRTFNDEVLTVKGVSIDSSSESYGLTFGVLMIPVTEITSLAQFKLTQEQFELLNNGVSKIRLSMIPKNHERTFKKDKIGKKLYKYYLDVKMKEDDF